MNGVSNRRWLLLIELNPDCANYSFFLLFSRFIFFSILNALILCPPILSFSSVPHSISFCLLLVSPSSLINHFITYQGRVPNQNSDNTNGCPSF